MLSISTGTSGMHSLFLTTQSQSFSEMNGDLRKQAGRWTDNVKGLLEGENTWRDGSRGRQIPLVRKSLVLVWYFAPNVVDYSQSAWADSDLHSSSHSFLHMWAFELALRPALNFCHWPNLWRSTELVQPSGLCTMMLTGLVMLQNLHVALSVETRQPEPVIRTIQGTPLLVCGLMSGINNCYCCTRTE